jgi:hypothetical protein
MTLREFFLDTVTFHDLDTFWGELGLRTLVDAAVTLLSNVTLSDGTPVPVKVSSTMRDDGVRVVTALLEGQNLLKVNEASLMKVVCLDSEGELRNELRAFVESLPSLPLHQLPQRAKEALEASRACDLILEIVRATYRKDSQRADELLAEAAVVAQRTQEQIVEQQRSRRGRKPRSNPSKTE